MSNPEGNIVTGPASLWTAPIEDGSATWTPMGYTDSGFQFTSTDLASPIESPIASVTASFERLRDATVTVEATFSGRLLSLLMGSDPDAEADETAGPDTFPCAGSGGRWSDLMAQIDELVDGEQA